MRTETKEKIANFAYPVAIAAALGVAEYFGARESLAEFSADKLEVARSYYGTSNPMFWGEWLDAHIRPFGVELLTSGLIGGLVGACIAEPLKRLINRRN